MPRPPSQPPRQKQPPVHDLMSGPNVRTIISQALVCLAVVIRHRCVFSLKKQRLSKATTARLSFLCEPSLSVRQTISSVVNGVSSLAMVVHGSFFFLVRVFPHAANVFVAIDDCSLRPHLVHCILAGSHYSDRQDIYDAVRGVYNPNRPTGCALAPPFEEWTEMRQLCDHVMCRYQILVVVCTRWVTLVVVGKMLDGRRVFRVLAEGLEPFAATSSAGTTEHR